MSGGGDGALTGYVQEGTYGRFCRSSNPNSIRAPKRQEQSVSRSNISRTDLGQ